MTSIRKNSTRLGSLPVPLDFPITNVLNQLPNYWLPLLLFVLLASYAATAVQAQAPKTDATFAFTTDVHVAFDGYDDHQGIDDMIEGQGASGVNALLMLNETLPATNALPWAHSDACVGTGFSFMKDLCNQVQLVRKLNHLPVNYWYTKSYPDLNGHQTVLGSAGKAINPPLGVIVAGDLTDCGAGSDNVKVWQGGVHYSENCDIDYTNGIPGMELQIFRQLFDQGAGTFQSSFNNFTPLSDYPVIAGLENPDSDVPLKYPIYPGLGNHDLGFDQSGSMMSYVRQWNSDAPASDYHHVLNSDDDSGSYSWNWGNLHVINVGVFAGSNNKSGATPSSNYPYDSTAMTWLKNDLSSYASAGQPVILVQHFGFDPESLSSSWYLGSANNAAQAEQDLWPVLAPYNVIGIFHGHHHEQAFYSFSPGETYSAGTATSTYHMAYDIFEPGPGFGQDFAAIHVTDQYMDVQATKWADDFKNNQTTVNFGLFFTKRLVPAPTAGGQVLADFGDSTATSIVYNGVRYLIGTQPNGSFTVRNMTNMQVVSRGGFVLTPKFIQTYTVGSTTNILVSDGYSIACYRMVPSFQLQQVWTEPLPLHGFTPVMSMGGIPYILVDLTNDAGLRFQFFQITNAGLVASTSWSPGGPVVLQSQMIAFTTPDQGFTMIRYTQGGAAQIYHGWVDTNGDTQLALMSQEQWVPDSNYDDVMSYTPNVFIRTVTLPDKSIAILVKSPACWHYNFSNECDTLDTVDSPFSVRTLTQDGNGTVVSWRGQIPNFYPIGSVSLVPMDPVNGNPAVGLLSSEGLFSTISLQE